MDIAKYLKLYGMCVAYLVQALLVKQRGEKVNAVSSNTYVSYQRRDMFRCKIITQSGNCKARCC